MGIDDNIKEINNKNKLKSSKEKNNSVGYTGLCSHYCQNYGNILTTYDYEGYPVKR